MKKSFISSLRGRNKQTNKQLFKHLCVVALVAASALAGYGQIKVSSDGKVNLGTTSNLCQSNFKVHSEGSLNVNGDLGLSQTLLFSSYYSSIYSPGMFTFGIGDWNTLDFSENVYEEGFIIGNGSLWSLGNSSRQFLNIHGYSIYANGVLVTSDKRLKENIREIESPLSKILKLKGLKYDFKDDMTDSLKNEKQIKEIKAKNKNRLGIMAQDLQQIIPEAVVYQEEDDDYYIDYNALTPVIIEAMKEQQVIIEDLQAEVARLKGKSNEKSANISTDNEAATLGQNIPNPFSTKAKIGIYLPSSIADAKLYIYNMQGVQIKTMAINERGNTSITIEGYSFDAGMYLYTLITDGKEVDTKKMILTK